MDRIWLQHYPEGVPSDIDTTQYRSVADLLEESFKRHASHPFSVCMDVWMDYAELDRLSARLGAWLQSRGLEPGARVASDEGRYSLMATCWPSASRAR